MFKRIHPKNVHEMSPKKCPQKVTQKKDILLTKVSMRCHQKCPRDVTPFGHEMSPIMSTRCLPPAFVQHRGRSQPKWSEFNYEVAGYFSCQAAVRQLSGCRHVSVRHSLDFVFHKRHMLSLAFALHWWGLQPRWSEFNCGVSESHSVVIKICHSCQAVIRQLSVLS